MAMISNQLYGNDEQQVYVCCATSPPVMWRCAGFKNVVYLPELQQCLVQFPEMLMRLPMRYSLEKDRFTYLATEQASAVLESWGFGTTAAAASKGAVLKRTLSLVSYILLRQATGMTFGLQTFGLLPPCTLTLQPAKD